MDRFNKEVKSVSSPGQKFTETWNQVVVLNSSPWTMAASTLNHLQELLARAELYLIPTWAVLEWDCAKSCTSVGDSFPPLFGSLATLVAEVIGIIGPLILGVPTLKLN